MQHFLKTITDWMLDKEEEMARSCAVPTKEIDYQLEKVAQQKVKVQQQYDDAMANLEAVEERLQKIKNVEILRCSSSSV